MSPGWMMRSEKVCEWGAPRDSPLWPTEKRPVRALILHHASDDDVTVDPVAMVRAMAQHHTLGGGEDEWSKFHSARFI